MNLLNHEDMIAFDINATCIGSAVANFSDYGIEYNIHGDIIRGYVPTENLYIIMNILATLPWIMKCILNLSYDFKISLASCAIENTSVLSYENKSLPAAWNLDMYDNVSNNIYNYPFSIDDEVDLWILDTGINSNHLEFEPGQVVDMDPTYTRINTTHPHGTGTGACAGGKNYGTSKKLKIYNYPVCRLGGSCAGSDIDKGLNKVLEHVKNRSGRSVINLSIGSYVGPDPGNTSTGQYFNYLFKSIEENGGIIVVSAGNSNQDACTWFYSYSPFVISVGSVNKNYIKSGFSNYGSCVDIWAFGDGVPTAYSVVDNTLIQYKSGTSFSSPSVAGLVANLLIQNQTLNREDILNLLYHRINNFTVPRYTCNSNQLKCCRGIYANTRMDKFCKSLSLYNCPAKCKIAEC